MSELEIRQSTGGPPPGSVAEWLQRTTRRFAAAGLPSPRADTERLAAYGLGLEWGDLWSRLRSPLPEAAVDHLEALARRREAGEPLAYILGSAEFFGLRIACGPGVLVPRPETEVTVEVALRLLEGIAHPRVVDLGTGSGAIAVAIAAIRQDAEVWATDRSADAIAWAQRNVEASDVRVRLRTGDLFEPLPDDLRGTFDLVVSNPPYVPSGAWNLVDRDVGAEPPEAVFAGPMGDEVLMRIVAEAPAWLRPDGALVLEVGTGEQATAVAAELSGWGASAIETDRAGKPRVVWARRS